jgi:tetratricopeptide (TPR) repeat protein
MAAMALLSAAGCGGTITRLKANQAAKQGNELYKVQEYEKALELYRKAIALNPDLNIAYYHSALCYTTLYKPGSLHPKDLEYLQSAIDFYLEFLRRVPDHQDAKNLLLNIYLQGRRYDDAIAIFEKELKDLERKGTGKDPVQASQLMQKLGMIYAKKGDFDTSLQWYQKRAEFDKKDPEALYTIGVLCWDKVYHQGITLDLDKRIELIELGLDNLKRAAAMKDDYFEAVSYINLLYREKAKVAQLNGNEEDFLKYTEEANKHMRDSLEMRKRVMAKK